jgi:hypothetical protein
LLDTTALELLSDDDSLLSSELNPEDSEEESEEASSSFSEVDCFLLFAEVLHLVLNVAQDLTTKLFNILSVYNLYLARTDHQ